MQKDDQEENSVCEMYSIKEKWFEAEAPLQTEDVTLKADKGELKEAQKIYEFDENKLIELEPINDAFLLETDTDIIKILNDLF